MLVSVTEHEKASEDEVSILKRKRFRVDGSTFLKLNFVFYYLVFKLRNYLSIRHFEKSGTVDIFHENPEPPDNLE